MRDIAPIAVHCDWPSPGNDPFYWANPVENSARIDYYPITGIPDWRMDGSGSAASIEDALVARRAVSSPLTIALSAVYDSGTRTGTLTASITNVSAGTVTGKFRMAVTESGLYYVAPNGETNHDFVMRDLVPDAAGQTVSLGPGGNTVINQPFTIAAGWVESNCQIVVFVQNDATKEIYQGARAFFPLNEPVLVLQGTQVTALPGGDGDVYFDTGESGAVVVTLANLNIASATGTTGTLTTTDPNLVIVDGSASFGTIPAYGEGSNSADPFVVQAAPGMPSGIWADASVQMNSALAYTTTLPIQIGIGTPTDVTGPFATYYAYENADLNYTQTPTYSWAEIDTALGGAGTAMNLTPDGCLTFVLPFTFRYFGVNCDSVSIGANGYATISRTYDGGTTPGHIPDASGPPGIIAALWCDLNPMEPGSGKVYYYNDTANHRFIAEWSRVYHAGGGNPETFEIILLDPAYYPTTTGDGIILVQYKTVSLPDLAVAGIENRAQTAGLEFQYFGAPNPAGVGIANNRVIKYTTDAPVRTDVPTLAAQPGPVTLLAASPNPFTQGTTLRYRLPERQEVALRIYSVDGRLVSTLAQGVAEAGWHDARWDGRDTAGRDVASGLYFARLETGKEVTIGKLMVLR